MHAFYFQMNIGYKIVACIELFNFIGTLWCFIYSADQNNLFASADLQKLAKLNCNIEQQCKRWIVNPMKKFLGDGSEKIQNL